MSDVCLDRQTAFEVLVATAQVCQVCPRMAGRRRVIGPANGPLDAEILVVAEAPGRHGADLTGVPLSGDRTGQMFDSLLAGAGLDRSRLFITNAVLCNPRTKDGRNDRPRAGELRECSRHLRSVIDLLDPRWVVSLGRVALDALALIEPHHANLARDVATERPWYGRRLIPLFHPGPRSLARRGFAQHATDYRRLRELTGDAWDGTPHSPERDAGGLKLGWGDSDSVTRVGLHSEHAATRQAAGGSADGR